MKPQMIENSRRGMQWRSRRIWVLLAALFVLLTASSAQAQPPQAQRSPFSPGGIAIDWKHPNVIYGIDNDGAANSYQRDSAGVTPSGQRGKKPVAKPIQRITEGEIGDVLFDGRWRFQVVSTQTVDSYTMKTDAEPYDYVNLSRFDLTKRVFTPKAGFTLIVIQCRVVNGQNSTQRLWTAISDNKMHTALMAMEGSPHPPIGYDFEGGPIQSKPLAPGATLNFSVVFSVPQGTKLKELLFTLRNNSSFEKGTDARVSLSTDPEAKQASGDEKLRPHR